MRWKPAALVEVTGGGEHVVSPQGQCLQETLPVGVEADDLVDQPLADGEDRARTDRRRAGGSLAILIVLALTQKTEPTIWAVPLSDPATLACIGSKSLDEARAYISAASAS